MSGLPSIKILTKQFQFLDQLRESGSTNMFGAGPYLEDAFGLKRRSGAPILSAWIKTFSHDSTPAERAKDAIERQESAA